MRDRIGLLTLALSCLFIGEMACTSQLESAKLPTRLSDEEFWSLSTALSEPAGVFRHSENLVSNEAQFAQTIRMLRPEGGVYIGVGPEQNFSYIARLQPAMAFIIDIRQENRNLHLMYKALFEAAADRADFVSVLFSRERPSGLELRTSVHDLFAAYGNVNASKSLYEANLRLLRARLVDAHRFPLLPEDLASIEYAFSAFYSDGPGIHYSRSRPENAAGPSYRSLMTSADLYGQARSYLADEEAFAFVKDLHARNMIVPVVGDFGGRSAITRVGDYIRKQRGSVSAFYSSNVEVYLNRLQMAAFCEGLATLPSHSRTWFIRSKGLQPLTLKLQSCVPAAR